MRMQRTLGGDVRVEGVALHGGGRVVVHLHPAPMDSGVRFEVGPVVIPASAEHVVDTQLATTLGMGGGSVRTVEHLLATLHGAGIDNVVVSVQGDEIPILDGCGAAWLEHLNQVGFVDQERPVREFVIEKTVEVRDGDRWARIEPATGFELDITIDFDHPSVGKQHLALQFDKHTFASEIAWARTFGFERLVPAMQRLGLVRGGSLDNALVFGSEGPLNEDGVRSADEPVRHKMLDALGDLALLGHPICGRLIAEKPGHGIVFHLLKALLLDSQAWKIR